MSVKEDLKVEFKVLTFNNSEIIRSKCFLDEKNSFWGEFLEFHRNGRNGYHGFYVNGCAIGIWTYYNENGSILCQDFHSFEIPGEIIEESEYKRQLAKIRLGFLKVPGLDLKICDYEQQ